MKTIRKKISIGFIALLVVLVCSVVINVFELNRMRDDTEHIIAESTKSTEYAGRMLDALQKQNSAVLNMVTFNSESPSEGFGDGIVEFNAALLEAMDKAPESAALKNIYEANIHYHNIIDQHSPSNNEAADKEWFMDSYIDAYYNLDSAIKSYLTSPKNSVTMRVSNLESDVYKTITPSVLTLLVAVLILLLFYFFIDTYYTKPVKRISRSLDAYVKNKVPYQVKLDEHNELSQLNDDIVELINNLKKYQ